ncbi:MAG: NFACT family protein [Oscillospiraceae bacterium]|jgi:predicted ribosome quality control (RQC) complex YloA/Tae2 family protein|nr:NFACT family protein [Oscillospiraceae bacterium]
MAFDGLTLSLVKKEIENAALGGRIDKIYIPSKDEIIIAIRAKGAAQKILLSASPACARIHLTGESVENPRQPPMFCMLLRKRLGGGKLIALRQHSCDRIIFLDFECKDEFGDRVTNTICIEVMGRHSNVILLNGGGFVVDSIKRVGLETSSVRQILPGIKYELPPLQDKLVLFDASPEEIVKKIRNGKDCELSRAIQNAAMGFSPVLAREAAHFAARGVHTLTSAMEDENWERLRFVLGKIKSAAEGGNIAPTAVIAPDGLPAEFSFLDIHQYPLEYKTRRFESMGQLLDFFYSEKSRVERVRARSQDLLKLLANASARIERRLAAQREELLQSGRREELKIKGDILSANLYKLEKGQNLAVLENFYDPELAPTEIKLEESLNPAQNAQKYYREYRKADAAEKKLKVLIEEGEAELAYVDSVFDALVRSAGESELSEIRDELAEQGYIKRPPGGKGALPRRLPPRKYLSADGFVILAGRNNISNDALSMKFAAKSDIWMHAQGIHGSHVIILTEGRQLEDIPPRTLEQAGALAAWHSKGRASSQVPVDYTQVKNLRKPRGAKPGKVIYDRFKTIFVRPDETIVRLLETR